MTALETPRLKLRRFATDDWQVLARLYADDLVMRHMQPGRGLTRDQAESRARGNITNFNDHWRRRGFGVWAVTDKPSGRLLGQCGLRYVDEAKDVEILYLLNKTVWGRGLASEAAGAALAHGFDTLGLARIIGLVRPENLASRRVLEKLGLQFDRIGPIFDMQCCWYIGEREGIAEPRAETA